MVLLGCVCRVVVVIEMKLEEDEAEASVEGKADVMVDWGWV